MSVSINHPLSDILQTVERPVVFDVIRKLMELTQISSKTQIRFYGEDARAAQYNSTITKDAEKDNLWPHKENIAIEVDEQPDTDRLLCNAVKGGDNLMIFHDPALDIGIKPVYASTKVRVSFNYKAADRNAALKWRNEVMTRFAMMRDIFLHDITYSYHFPEVYVAILQELYRLRQNIAGYDDSFGKWFTQHLTNRATLLTNQAATHGVWAIAETQARVQGQFDFEGAPEKATRDDEPNLWNTAFTYVFQYDKPINSVMVYPMVVHQQLLSTKYRYDSTAYSYQALRKSYTQSMRNFAKFELDAKDMLRRSNKGLAIPSFDAFNPTTVPAATVRVATILTTFSPQDKRTLFDLDGLGDYHLRQEVLDFIKESEYPYLTQPYASILQLHPYKGVRIQDQSLLSVNGLAVAATQDLDLRSVYRVRLSLVADLSYLPEAALARLKRYPLAAAWLINAINQSINSLGRQRDIRVNRVPSQYLHGLGLRYDQDQRDRSTAVVSPIGTGLDLRGHTGLRWGLVEYLFITAESNDQRP